MYPYANAGVYFCAGACPTSNTRTHMYKLRKSILSHAPALHKEDLEHLPRNGLAAENPSRISVMNLRRC